MKPNSLAAFYDALARGPESAVGVLPPPDMGQGVGHFNVFSLAGLRGAAPMTFSRREYYKITLCRGRSQVECADQAPHIGANALFLVTPRVPYRWLPLTEDFTGYSCLFDDAFLLPARTGVVLVEHAHGQPVRIEVYSCLAVMRWTAQAILIGRRCFFGHGIA